MTLRSTAYAETRSLQDAIDRHTGKLGVFEGKANRFQLRVRELSEQVRGDEALLCQLAAAQALADAAGALMRTLRYTWESERTALLRAEELNVLRFSTSMAALRGLLEGTEAAA